MIDLHSHVLPGIDDGARSLDDSLAMVRAAIAGGVEVLAATPHVRNDYPTTAERMEQALAAVRDAVREQGLPLQIVGGAELALEEAARLDDGELRRLTIGGGDALLLEFPYHGWPVELGEQLFRLQARGYRTVLAHPERSVEVVANPERLQPLVEGGALVQVTAASLAGRFGRRSQSTARKLIEFGLVHLLASDMHDATGRAGLDAGAKAVGNDALARWLTDDVPAAILSNDDLPPRPRVGRGFRFFQRSS